MGRRDKIPQALAIVAMKTVFLLLLVHSATALLLAPRAPPHMIIKSPAAPRAAVNAMFGIDLRNEDDLRKAAECHRQVRKYA